MPRSSRGAAQHSHAGAARTEREEPERTQATSAREPRSSAPARGIWSGSISFGLLQIPVTLYAAERRTEGVHFRLLDKHDLAPIRYERVNSTTGKPVEWKDIVKGYELEPETYVVMEDEDLKKANVRATQTIDIQDFVPVDDIDPAFFEAPYYVVPQRRSAKAYVLLREALKTKGAAAVATFVLRTREHLCALMPVGDAIMLEVLRFDHELRHADDMPLPAGGLRETGVTDRELAMAEQLISGMMADWAPSKYADHYHDDVLKLVEEKAKTGTAKAHHIEPRGTVASDVVNLLDLLQRSVAEKTANDAKANGGPARTKAAPSEAEATGPNAGPKAGPKKAKKRAHKKEAAA